MCKISIVFFKLNRSCGVSLYVMLTGVFPFARETDDECTNVVRMQRMFTRIIQGEYAPLHKVSLQVCCCWRRRRCCMPPPLPRCRCRLLCCALAHP